MAIVCWYNTDSADNNTHTLTIISWAYLQRIGSRRLFSSSSYVSHRQWTLSSKVVILFQKSISSLIILIVFYSYISYDSQHSTRLSFRHKTSSDFFAKCFKREGLFDYLIIVIELLQTSAWSRQHSNLTGDSFNLGEMLVLQMIFRLGKHILYLLLTFRAQTLANLKHLGETSNL